MAEKECTWYRPHDWERIPFPMTSKYWGHPRKVCLRCHLIEVLSESWGWLTFAEFQERMRALEERTARAKALVNDPPFPGDSK